MIFKDATRPDEVGTYAETMERVRKREAHFSSSVSS